MQVTYPLFASYVSAMVLTEDTSKLENHTFFGSAEHKLKNFYTKIKNIEGYINEISTSFNVTASSTNTNRKNLFKKIDTIKEQFTPYENWLYKDYTSKYSFPKAGFDYAKIPPVTGSFDSTYQTIEGNATIMRDSNGIDIVYRIDSSGEDVILSGSFDSASAAAAQYGIDSYWYTGSHNLESGGSTVAYWKLSGSRAYFHQTQNYQLSFLYLPKHREQLSLSESLKKLHLINSYYPQHFQTTAF